MPRLVPVISAVRIAQHQLYRPCFRARLPARRELYASLRHASVCSFVFISLISISQFSPLQLANRRADPGDGANDLVAGYDRVDKRHDTALLVVHRMQVGVADTAEQDFRSARRTRLVARGIAAYPTAMSRWPRRSPSHFTSCLLSVCCCGLIVFVVDLFHPLDDLAVQGFLNGDMRHRRCRRGAMPMLFSCRAPDPSPARISSFGAPLLCTQPHPDVTIKVCPSGCVCHADRALGSKVTLAQRTRAGSGASNSGSIRTLPVKYSAGPLFEGCEPLFLMFVSGFPFRHTGAGRSPAVTVN